MKSTVYFTPFQESEALSSIQLKVRGLFDKSRLLDCVAANDRAVIKMHFGEEGNTGHVRPEYVRVVSDAIRDRASSIIVSDTNTLYRGRRIMSADHEKLALEHGFAPAVIGAELLIADELKKENCVIVALNRKFVKEAKILRLFKEADALIGVAHFKGHMMTGFGGALKNIGMGCASREGKLAQHSTVSPKAHSKKCTGCGACRDVCPAGAITIVNGKSRIDNKKCIGCAQCIAACKYEAMDVNWGAGSDTMVERMVEYTLAVLGERKKNAFINFATKITKECDCLAKDDPAIAPDVGVFASADPVALDQATFDLVCKKAGGDVFKQAHPSCDSQKQLANAEKLGLGTREYELIEA